MNTILTDIMRTARGPYLFESSDPIHVHSPLNSIEQAEDRPSFFRFIPQDDKTTNRCYSVSYVILWLSQSIIEVIIFLILLQRLGVQTANIFGVTYFFHYITITVPIETLSRVACTSLSWFIKCNKPLSFLIYSLVYIFISLTFTCTMAFLCTLFGNLILKYLHGDTALLFAATYYTSLWVHATVVTVATCIHHILLVEGRSFILLAAMLTQSFVQICTFMIILFYSSMSMSKEISYWTATTTNTTTFPFNEFFYNGVLYTVDNSSITPTFDIYRFISPFTPCYLSEDSAMYPQSKPIKAHFYSYQLSIILSSLTFIFVSLCLVSLRTKEMGWSNYVRNPITVSVQPYLCMLKWFSHLSISSKDLKAVLLHFIQPWIPLYIDSISNMIPLFAFNLASVREIIPTERTTLTIMQHTLYYILSDMFNAPNVAITRIFIPLMVEAYITKLYKKEITLTRRAIFFCIFISVMEYPLNLCVNQLVYKFQPGYITNITVLEKLWLEEIYGNPNALMIQPATTIIMSVRILLLSHLTMEHKTTYLYLLACERLLFSMLFTFSRDDIFNGVLIRELFICDILISVTSMIGLILCVAKYAILKF